MHFFDYSSNLFLVLIVMLCLLYMMVFFVLIQRRDQSKRNQKEFIYSTFTYCTTNVNFEREWQIIYPREESDGILRSNLEYTDAERYAAELRIFNIFNSVSVGIHTGGLDNDTVYWLMGHDMKHFYNGHKYLLATIRNSFDDPYLFINYEMLIDEWEEMGIKESLQKLKEKKRYLS